jgi:selenocysteine-specific elongation factor
MIVGTAGHIDHGKTALVKALTGVDADRLPEEKARGITLDLGYAYTALPGGDVLGFVDVPGHERLVHNMVAGATGIDFVLLVVAADDGPMPQTREHLQIVDLLGLSRGAVALTKIDAVPAERVVAATAEVRALLGATPLADAPLFPVSSVTGEGVPALRAHLEAAAAGLPPPHAAGRFRLAIDRCFTLKGTGIVVTGTAHAGVVHVGDELVLSPAGIGVRVRGIHAQDRPAASGHAGQRCALNLAGPGFEKALVRRGDWAVDARLHAPTQRLDVWLRVLGTEPRALAHWTPVHMHLGAAHVPGRVALLEADRVAPGSAGLAQLVLDRAIGALGGDRFVVRDQSASRSVGGGVVLDAFPPHRGRRAAARLQLLHAWRPLDPVRALEAALEHARTGVDLDRFAVAWNVDAERLRARVRMRVVPAAAAGGIAFSDRAWEGLRQAIVTAVQAEHERVPDMIGVGRERLRRLAAPVAALPAFDAVLDELLAGSDIAATGPWLHDPAHRVRLVEPEERLWQRVRPLLDAQPWQAPRVRDLARALDVDEALVRATLKAVARLGEVYPVAHDHYFTRHAVEGLAGIVRDLDRQSGAATAASFRDRLGTGRKLAIHILEFFDRIGFTRRVGDRHLVRNASLFAAEPRPASEPDHVA